MRSKEITISGNFSHCQSESKEHINTVDIKNCIIVARGRNGVIGQDGDLPWRLRDDLAFFKEVTKGKPVIMGRKTWESLQVQPLPDRDNFVISRDWSYAARGARVYSSFGVALNAARSMARDAGVDEVFVIGGGSIYERALPIVDRLYITEVNAGPQGDVTFPPIDEQAFAEVWRREHIADEHNDHSFVTRRLDCRRGLRYLSAAASSPLFCPNSFLDRFHAGLACRCSLVGLDASVWKRQRIRCRRAARGGR